MLGYGIYVLGAFSLYVLILPLVGIILGTLLYVGLPYIAGIAVAGMGNIFVYGSFFYLGVFWVLALIWVVGVALMRQASKKILQFAPAWYEGHGLAAKSVIMMGHP